MSRLFAAGDTLPRYGRVNALLGELQEKEKAGGEVRRGAARPQLCARPCARPHARVVEDP
jgi:hypothetical protein